MVVRAFEIMATDHLHGGRGVDGQARNMDGYVGIYPHGFCHDTSNISLYCLQKEDGLEIKAAAKTGRLSNRVWGAIRRALRGVGTNGDLGETFLTRGTREWDHGH